MEAHEYFKLSQETVADWLGQPPFSRLDDLSEWLRLDEKSALLFKNAATAWQRPVRVVAEREKAISKLLLEVETVFRKARSFNRHRRAYQTIEREVSLACSYLSRCRSEIRGEDYDLPNIVLEPGNASIPAKITNLGTRDLHDVDVVQSGMICRRVANELKSGESRLIPDPGEGLLVVEYREIVELGGHEDRLFIDDLRATNKVPIPIDKRIVNRFRSWYDINRFLVYELGCDPFPLSAVDERPINLSADSESSVILSNLGDPKGYADFKVYYAPEDVRDINGPPESILRSDELDVKLWRHEFDALPIVLGAAPSAIRPLANRPQECMTALRVKRKSLRDDTPFFDAPKMCLACDLLPETTELRLFEGSYYKSFLTNELVTLQICDDFPAVTPRPRSVAFPSRLDADSGRYELLSIAESGMFNHIGTSTLLFSAKDRKIQLWVQGNAVVSEGKVQTTGSGSGDWSDWVTVDRSRKATLAQLICGAVERELREEADVMGQVLSAGVELESRLLGYFRWSRRGGKPEFLVLTKADVDSRDLSPNREEVLRSNRFPLEIPAENLDDFRAEIQRFLEDTNTHRRLSVPLWAALQSLLRRCDDDPRGLSSFLWSA